MDGGWRRIKICRPSDCLFLFCCCCNCCCCVLFMHRSRWWWWCYFCCSRTAAKLKLVQSNPPLQTIIIIIICWWWLRWSLRADNCCRASVASGAAAIHFISLSYCCTYLQLLGSMYHKSKLTQSPQLVASRHAANSQPDRHNLYCRSYSIVATPEPRQAKPTASQTTNRLTSLSQCMLSVVTEQPRSRRRRITILRGNLYNSQSLWGGRFDCLSFSLRLTVSLCLGLQYINQSACTEKLYIH